MLAFITKEKWHQTFEMKLVEMLKFANFDTISKQQCMNHSIVQGTVKLRSTDLMTSCHK